jgi:microcystin-dependent protein
MAGSLSLSLSQQFDSQGRPLSGGKLYFFATGTSTPQNAYQDTALTLPHPNPMTLDSSGRIAAFYLSDGTIKIRLTDIGGVPVLAYDGLLVIGPSSGAGASPSVDATTVLATGDIKLKYGTGALTGFVRLNARTIGSTTSGASERANSDTQALWEYLYNADANLTVSGGRTGNSTNDFNANKTIILPDFRGRVPAALDDMGNSAAGRLTSSFFGASAIVLGNAGGVESKTLAIANLPAYTPAGTIIIVDPLHSHTYNTPTAGSPVGTGGSNVHTDFATAATSSSATGLNSSNTTFSGTAQGGTSTAFNVAQPTILVTYYIKL